jgi:hypothetical protein
LLCFDALDRVLGGSAVPREDYAELHEHFVKVFGLDRGEALDAGAVRFERQLIRPKEQVWSILTGAAEATVGEPPPAGFVAKGIEPGPVEVVTPSVELVYPAQHGTVRWQLRDGNGGARLVVTQSGPAEPFLTGWHDLIEIPRREPAGSRPKLKPGSGCDQATYWRRCWAVRDVPLPTSSAGVPVNTI